jgi:hypothetical protein
MSAISLGLEQVSLRMAMISVRRGWPSALAIRLSSFGTRPDFLRGFFLGFVFVAAFALAGFRFVVAFALAGFDFLGGTSRSPLLLISAWKADWLRKEY